MFNKFYKFRGKYSLKIIYLRRYKWEMGTEKWEMGTEKWEMGTVSRIDRWKKTHL